VFSWGYKILHSLVQYFVCFCMAFHQRDSAFSGGKREDFAFILLNLIERVKLRSCNDMTICAENIARLWLKEILQDLFIYCQNLNELDIIALPHLMHLFLHFHRYLTDEAHLENLHLRPFCFPVLPVLNHSPRSFSVHRSRLLLVCPMLNRVN
jgi:hypothetical protein